jgi:heptosyltransferase-2
LLCPGANKAAKRWPAERFRAVAEGLATKHGLAAVATGSPHEASVVRRLVEGTPIVDLVQAGVTLGSLKGVAAEAAVMITNDTGPRHIAAALGTPVVCLYGPTDARWTTLEDSTEHRLLAEPFLVEELTADDHPDACDITRIAVGDVIAATAGLLDAGRDQGAAASRASPASTPPA